MASPLSLQPPVSTANGPFPEASAPLEDDAKFLAFLTEPLAPYDPGTGITCADAMVDDLFGDREAQSVIPPFMSTANGQQQQAATFSANQFPSSWSSYLSRGTQQPQTQPAEALSKTASHGSGSSDNTAAPRQSQEAKQARIREKNRRAMKKFRERQKEKSKESETRMQDLTNQLQSLQLENERLLSQNRSLKLATMCPKFGSESEGQSAAPLQAAPPAEWEPRRGWTDFSPQATMIVYLGPSDTPLRITAQQMRVMSQPQMTELVRGYVMRAAPLLVAANDDMTSPAAEQLQGLKYELNALAAFCAMNNPVLMHQKWGVSPEGAPQAPLDTPLPEDLHKSSMHLLAVLNVTDEQRAMLVKVHQLVTGDIRRLKTERSTILAALAEKHEAEANTPEPKRFSDILSLLKELTANTEDIHRCQCIYGASCWSTVLNPIQTAKVVIHSFPGPPNLWLLTTAAAEAGGAELQVDPELQRRVEARYSEIWKWHSKMARAGALRSCPTMASCDSFSLASSAPLGRGDTSMITTLPVPEDDVQLFREHAPPPCDILAPLT